MSVRENVFEFVLPWDVVQEISSFLRSTFNFGVTCSYLHELRWNRVTILVRAAEGWEHKFSHIPELEDCYHLCVDKTVYLRKDVEGGLPYKTRAAVFAEFLGKSKLHSLILNVPLEHTLHTSDFPSSLTYFEWPWCAVDCCEQPLPSLQCILCEELKLDPLLPMNHIFPNLTCVQATFTNKNTVQLEHIPLKLEICRAHRATVEVGSPSCVCNYLRVLACSSLCVTTTPSSPLFPRFGLGYRDSSIRFQVGSLSYRVEFVQHHYTVWRRSTAVCHIPTII